MDRFEPLSIEQQPSELKIKKAKLNKRTAKKRRCWSSAVPSVGDTLVLHFSTHRRSQAAWMARAAALLAYACWPK